MRNVLVHHLDRFPDALEAGRDAQDVVLRNDSLPGLLEASNIERTVDLEHELFAIDPRIRFHDRMEQHPLLHLGQGEDPAKVCIHVGVFLDHAQQLIDFVL